jgi:hypothetical protein
MMVAGLVDAPEGDHVPEPTSLALLGAALIGLDLASATPPQGRVGRCRLRIRASRDRAGIWCYGLSSLVDRF